MSTADAIAYSFAATLATIILIVIATKQPPDEP
jgi:hypothetical protein